MVGQLQVGLELAGDDRNCSVCHGTLENHYGSRSERGTKAAAICCSLIESAKLAGIEVQAYITAAVYGIEQGIAPERLLPLRELWA